MKLLIVEEVPALRRRSLLAGLELAIDECRDGREMPASRAARQPDWVLLDFNLSDTDALAAVREISLAHPRIRVVIVSDNGNLLLLDAAGACGYVLKDNLLEVRHLLNSTTA